MADTARRRLWPRTCMASHENGVRFSRNEAAPKGARAADGGPVLVGGALVVGHVDLLLEDQVPCVLSGRPQRLVDGSELTSVRPLGALLVEVVTRLKSCEDVFRKEDR